MNILQVYYLCVMIFFLYFLYNVVIKKSIEKGKSKYLNYIVIAVFGLFGIFNFYHSMDNEYADKNSFHKFFDEPFKKNYQVTKIDGKTYAILDGSYTLGKYLIAEAEYNKNKNESKGIDITIDYSKIELIDKNGIGIQFIKNFDKIILKNKDFDIVKGKNLVYVYGSTYKIENQNDNNVTIKLKTGKKTKFEKLVPMENNEIIPENYLEDNGEKTLTVLLND